MTQVDQSTIQEAVFARIEEEAEQYEDPEGAGEPRPSNGAGLTSKEILDALNSNEDGDARLFIELHRGRFLFDHAAACWYEWAEHFWKEDELNQAMAGVESVIDVYAGESRRQGWNRVKAERAEQKDKARQHAATEAALIKRVRALQSKSRKQDVLFLAAVGAASLGITGQEWDRDPWLLGCSNGVIDLRTGEHRPGRPDDFLKTVSPIGWKGLNESAPTWDRFLFEVFDGDAELADFTRRLFGYTASGRTTDHVSPILWGKGRNGKGTLLETLAFVLGPYAGQVEAELLLKQKFTRQSGAPSSDIMTLRGKRLVWASETDEGRKLNAGKWKWLSGGDTLTGREVYGKRQTSFRPSHKIFLLTNHRPHADADDYALWKRLTLIPFNLSFIDEPKLPNERQADPTLPDRLKAEASGILAWLVRGALEWKREGLRPPGIVKGATEEYRQGEDIIGLFIAECCTTGPGIEVQAGVLYAAFKKWTEENGIEVPSRTAFGKQLKERFDSYKTNYVYYMGLGLTDGL